MNDFGDYNVHVECDLVFTSDAVIEALWWGSFCMTWFFIGITHTHVQWKASE